jgi:hypothetical protein
MPIRRLPWVKDGVLVAAAEEERCQRVKVLS